MTNYNVGEMVTLKGEDELKKIRYVTETMLSWANERAMIVISNNERDFYTLDIDKDYIWGRSCFEGEPIDNDDLKEEYKNDYEEDDAPHTKFKVGDRVRVKKDIEQGFGVPDKMVKMAGKTATVVEISNPNTGSCYLEFDEDYAYKGFIWFEELLEFIEDDDDVPTTPTESNEPTTFNIVKQFNIAKHKYDIGDYVRIVDINELERLADIDDCDYTEAPSGVIEDMFDYASKLARITDVEYDSRDNYWKYMIDLDDGMWSWNESMFEYRLGNYEDNTISDFTYMIGYVYKDITHEFEGNVVGFDINGKSTFIDKNGKVLTIPHKDIAYIVPIED